MKSIIYFLIFFFIGIFIYNIQKFSIEPMCIVPVPKGGNKNYEACQQNTIERNNSRMNILEKTFKNLTDKLKIQATQHNLNKQNLKKNNTTIKKMNTTVSGGDVDVSGACDKYPESC